MLESLISAYFPIAIITPVLVISNDGNLEEIITKSLLWPVFVLKMLIKTFIKLISQW